MNNGIEIVKYGEADYPEALAELEDCPKELYYRGDIKCLSKRCIAIVGSRTSTAYGRQMANVIAGKLASKGVTVVSGMAKGIDTASHIGTIEAGGKTVAVLGCGVDICYPAENHLLKKQIENSGVVISEYPPGTEPKPYHFPNRNRIVSGLCEGVIVVQARTRSGALITAELAVEQGRRIYAVPGNIDSSYNLGNNKLIKDGVTPLISTEDILEELELNKVTEEDALKSLSETEFSVYDILSKRGEMSIDELCIFLDKPAGFLTPILSVMEMKGFIFCEIGKIFLANP